MSSLIFLAPDASAAPGETVTRPEPGLARGVWEAPRWAFLVAIALVLLFSLAYLAKRAGLFHHLWQKRRPSR